MYITVNVIESYIEVWKTPLRLETSSCYTDIIKRSWYDPNNYHLVSLTSQVCKILEFFVSSSVTEFFALHRLISNSKMAGTNLLTALNDWTSAMDNGTGIDIIFLDFQEAIDTVSHSRLI